MTGQTPIALTVAGSDSGGGAGIQADLKTFAALGVYGASAITALTVQNTLGVRSVHAVPAEVVRAQIEAALDDFDVRAVKVGMLANGAIVAAVAKALTSPSPRQRGEGRDEGPRRSWEGSAQPLIRRFAPPSPRVRGDGTAPFLVFDPVLAASSGDALAGAGFVDAVRAKLLPLVDCLTPNLPEAAALLGEAEAGSEDAMIRQGRALLALGPGAVLMKGGHLPGDEAVDLLVTAAGVERFAAAKIASPNTHGTGCTLSSAIAAHVVDGLPLAAAVAAAKAFVGAAIARGAQVRLGAGVGPLLQSPLVSASPAVRSSADDA